MDEVTVKIAQNASSNNKGDFNNDIKFWKRKSVKVCDISKER